MLSAAAELLEAVAITTDRERDAARAVAELDTALASITGRKLLLHNDFRSNFTKP